MADGYKGKLQGDDLAQDLFEDMGRKVQNMFDGGVAVAEHADQRVTEEIDSLCMNCHEDGTTRLLLTRIPYFREIVIMSFGCPHCGFQNNEIQSAGQIQEKGVKYNFRVESAQDLQRQVVKSDNCVFRIEDLDLEIPPGKGQFTNLEGILSGVLNDLESHQAERLEQMPKVGAKVGQIILQLQDMVNGSKLPFTVSVDDPSGNSWIETRPSEVAGKRVKSEYNRTAEQNSALGLGAEASGDGAKSAEGLESDIRPEYHSSGMVPSLQQEPAINNVDNDDIIENQVYSFPASCPGCAKPCATNMKMVNIPHFKQVVLMSTACEHCGYRSNEVKTGGEVPDKARKITLEVKTREDLARDILKSESAALYCPQLQMRVEPGTMGGRFTTVEGILVQIRRDLRAQAFGLEDGDSDVPQSAADSMQEDSRRSWEDFFQSLTDAIDGKLPFTLVLEDPLASSYVQSLTAPEPDPQIKFEDYYRTEQEEEDWGLKDMKTEGYEEG